MSQQPDPTPFERFTLDPVKRDRLKALLSDPVLTEAMDIADDLMRPKSGAATDGNQPLAIARFHQSAGADEFQKKLRNLTKEPAERKPFTMRKLAESEADLPDQP